MKEASERGNKNANCFLGALYGWGVDGVVEKNIELAMECGTCKEYEYQGQNAKGYCNRYRAYYYHDDSCSHWEESDNYSSGSSGCFLTTACCEQMGLADDCEELTVMREFRDSYLLRNSVGEEIVKSYYKVAPQIVEKINARNDKEKIYKEMYQKIVKIVELIKAAEGDEAVAEYVKLLLFAQKSCV